MSSNTKWLVGIVAVIVLACACVGVLCLALGGLAVFNYNRPNQSSSIDVPQVETKQAFPLPTIVGRPTNTPAWVATPTTDAASGTAAPGNPTPTAAAQSNGGNQNQGSPASQEAEQTLKTLEDQVVPVNDPRDLASRLEGKHNIPETVGGTPPNYQIGATQTFWASNNDTNKNFKVNAVLRYATPHLYFWVEDGVGYSQSALKQLSDTFESKIYPTDRDFFGSEWTPGIDNDPHLYVVYAGGLGSQVAGYYSSADEIPPEAHQYSNAHEMFFMNSDSVRLDEEYIYSTMAHEFQHMIHWHLDRNEESWVNEGFSELAAFLNGYDVGGKDWEFAADPDIQLTYWPSPPSAPHYGAAFLYWAYFLDRFGDKATQAVVANTDNGMDSIDKVLASLKETDPKTGKLITADDFFADWAVTLFLNNAKVEDGRYVYKRYTSAPKPGSTEKINNCSPNWNNRTVHQFGIDYIDIQCSGNVTLNFEGAAEVGVLPEKPSSGQYAFWSNKGDESDMTLTHTFDFSNISGPVTLTYKTWYDLEKDYDYAYLEASENGMDWTILKTPSGRDKSEDPSGNSFGWGYNGTSGNWKDESIDLSQYAGKKVQLRFEYVTDAAVNGEGLLIDDMKIPQANYSEDFEKGDGGWVGKGFVRIENRLPQEFRVSIIREGQTTTVEHITLGADGKVSIPLQFNGDLRDAVLVVSGVTRFTTQEANYRFSFSNH